MMVMEVEIYNATNVSRVALSKLINHITGKEQGTRLFQPVWPEQAQTTHLDGIYCSLPMTSGQISTSNPNAKGAL